MIQKITPIVGDKRFTGITEYFLMREDTQKSNYDLCIKIIKVLLEEFPNCLDESEINRILEKTEALAQRQKKDPNTYFHYQQQHNFRFDNQKSMMYLKVGALKVDNNITIDLSRNVPIQLYNYYSEGPEYATKLITDFEYNRSSDTLDCVGMAYVEPWDNTYRTFIGISNQLDTMQDRIIKLKDLNEKQKCKQIHFETRLPW